MNNTVQFIVSVVMGLLGGAAGAAIGRLWLQPRFAAWLRRNKESE